MMTIEEYYKTLPYRIIPPSDGRAFLPEVADEEAWAGLMEVLRGCTSGEIEVYLDMVLRGRIDGMYVETCLLGVVAALRGVHLGTIPTGPWRTWEEKYIFPGGPVEKQAVLIGWLVEALDMQG